MAQNVIPADGTADGTGAIRIIFPPISVNAEFTGTVSVPKAPASAQWQVIINDQSVSSLGGSSSYGPFQLNASDVLELVGAGVAANGQYQGIMVGQVVYGSIGSVVPIPTASAVLASTVLPAPESLLGPIPVPPGSTTMELTVPPGFRTVIVAVETGTSTEFGVVTAVELQAVIAGGGFYLYHAAPYLEFPWQTITNIRVSPAVTQTYVLTVVIAIGFTNAQVTVYGDTDSYDDSAFFNGDVQVASAGSSTSPLISGPCRLLTADINGSGPAAIEIGGTLVMETAAAGQSKSLTFPERTIVPDGVAVTTVGGTCSVSYAFP